MKVYTVPEVAAAKNITKSAVYVAVREGRLARVETVSGLRVQLFTEDEVKKYLAARPGRPRKIGHK